MEMRGGWTERRLTVAAPLSWKHFPVGDGSLRRVCVWSAICSLAFYPVGQARADTFKLVSALQSEVLSEDNRFQSARTGQTIGEPWRFRTGPEGRLLVSSTGLQVELQPLSEVSLDQVEKPPSKGAVQSYLKPASDGPKHKSLPAPVMTLHRGTLFVQAGPRPVSVETKLTRVDARHAIFAISTSPESGEMLSVLKGQIKVTDGDKKVTFVPAGNTLRLALGSPPALSLLSDHSESQEHTRGLALLESVSPLEAITSSPAQDVGEGAQAPFDLSQRRRSFLLAAPNPSNVGGPDVSPEIPNSEQPNP